MSREDRYLGDCPHHHQFKCWVIFATQQHEGTEYMPAVSPLTSMLLVVPFIKENRGDTHFIKGRSGALVA